MTLTFNSIPLGNNTASQRVQLDLKTLRFANLASLFSSWHVSPTLLSFHNAALGFKSLISKLFLSSFTFLPPHPLSHQHFHILWVQHLYLLLAFFSCFRPSFLSSSLYPLGSPESTLSLHSFFLSFPSLTLSLSPSVQPIALQHLCKHSTLLSRPPFLFIYLSLAHHLCLSPMVTPPEILHWIPH